MEFAMEIIPWFMILAGLAVFILWIADIASGKFSKQGNFFLWKEGENLLWPHILAELLMAALLVTGGAALLFHKEWALFVAFFSLGSLFYSCLNSSGWVLASKERLPYGIPIWISLLGSVVSFVVLFLNQIGI